MGFRNPRQKSINGVFSQVGEEPLSRQVLGVRLPLSLHELVHPIPNRSDWLRRVIAEAAQRELMNDAPVNDAPQGEAVEDAPPVVSPKRRGRKPKAVTNE